MAAAPRAVTKTNGGHIHALPSSSSSKPPGYHPYSANKEVSNFSAAADRTNPKSTPGGLAPLTSHYDKVSEGRNWKADRAKLDTTPNEANTDAIAKGMFDIFVDLGKELRKDNTTSGPNIMWHMLPAVLDAMNNTPHEYEHAQGFNDASPLIFFIGFTYGDGGHTLNIKQNKFRMVVLGKVKTAVCDFLKGFYATEAIQVVYTKEFFYNSK